MQDAPGAAADHPDRHQLPGLGASGRPGRADRAAGAARLRRRGARRSSACGTSAASGCSSWPARSASTTGSTRGCYQRFTEAAAALDVAELPELYVHAVARSINGRGDRHGPSRSSWSTPARVRAARRRRAALPARPRAGPRAQRPRGLQDDHDDPDPLGGATWPGCRSARSRCGRSSRRCCEWWRKAELSADRAGLLAGQDPAAALRLLMKLAGGGDLSADRHRRVPGAGRRVRGRRRPARQPAQDAA